MNMDQQWGYEIPSIPVFYNEYGQSVDNWRQLPPIMSICQDLNQFNAYEQSEFEIINYE